MFVVDVRVLSGAKQKSETQTRCQIHWDNIYHPTHCRLYILCANQKSSHHPTSVSVVSVIYLPDRIKIALAFVVWICVYDVHGVINTRFT